MDVYLAAPIFNPDQIRVVEAMKEIAEHGGHTVFSPYHNSRDIWNGRAPKDCSPEERAQVLSDNIVNINWCDVLLAWVGGMGGFTDPGVVWEMGYAYAKSKFTVAYIDYDMDSDRQGMNLMLAGTIDAVARGYDELEGVMRILPIDPKTIVRRQYSPAVLGQEREPIV